MLLPQIDLGVRNTTSQSDLKRLRFFMSNYVVKERRKKQKASNNDEHFPKLHFDSNPSTRDDVVVSLHGEVSKAVARSDPRFEPILTSAGRKGKCCPPARKPIHKHHSQSGSKTNAKNKEKKSSEESTKLNQTSEVKIKQKQPKNKEKADNQIEAREEVEKLVLGKSELIPEQKLLDRRSSFVELFKRRPRNQRESNKYKADYTPPKLHSSLDFPSPYVTQLGHPIHRRSQTHIAVRPQPEVEERLIDIDERKVKRSCSVQAKRSAASALLARDKTTLQFKRIKAVYKVKVEEERILRQKTFYDSLEKLQLQHVMEHNKRITNEQREREEALNKRHRQLKEVHGKFERERTQRWNNQYVSSKRFNTETEIIKKEEKNYERKATKPKRRTYMHFSKSKIHAKNIEKYSTIFDNGVDKHPHWGPVASPVLQVSLMGVT